MTLDPVCIKNLGFFLELLMIFGEWMMGAEVGQEGSKFKSPSTALKQRTGCRKGSNNGIWDIQCRQNKQWWRFSQGMDGQGRVGEGSGGPCYSLQMPCEWRDGSRRECEVGAAWAKLVGRDRWCQTGWGGERGKSLKLAAVVTDHQDKSSFSGQLGRRGWSRKRWRKMGRQQVPIILLRSSAWKKAEKWVILHPSILLQHVLWKAVRCTMGGIRAHASLAGSISGTIAVLK